MREHPGLAWLREHRPELERDYPGEWVAADDNGIVAHGRNFAAVSAEVVAQKGREDCGVTWAQIPPPGASA